MARQVTPSLLDGDAGSQVRSATADLAARRFAIRYEQWLRIRHQRAQLNARMSELRSEMQPYIDEHGERDAAGHCTVKIEPVTIGDVTYTGATRQVRRKTLLKEETAEALLRERIDEETGLSLYDLATRSIIDQNEVYDLYQRGKLSDADMEEIFEVQINHAFVDQKAA